MKTLPLSEVKANLSSLVAKLERNGQGICITKSGKAAAILISQEEYDGMKETLEILSNPELMAEIRKGIREMKAGKFKSYGKKELDGLLGE